ncbi:hypothetical protein A1O1_02225 [Capronia coronata CBS 617.96]|uniref:Uncharacterized protein n=1 Tax=Capronia coronata CBS 617.96 TaxID=1182541 RepID=W9YLT9_9EURO|nr:uncharacterized protein A1O1_02225 [Capronia coronata CBS 617.96]EXJ93832.1 hypothetical protein A1O1_02225 [Capronia coronata CBS 617.96]
MPDDRNNTSADASTPPPLDPFPTYQTPYPRSDKDDDNPFIQFRRFADEQLSSFFQGIPQLFGFSSGKDAWKKDFDELMRRSNELEEGWRKQFEQEMEEMRQEFEKSKAAAWKVVEGGEKSPNDNTPWWTGGNASNSTLNGTASDNAKNSPALYDEDGQPRTELDAYNGVQGSETATEIPVIKSTSRKTSNTSSDSWFSSFGWDGKRREQETGSGNDKISLFDSLSARRQVSRPTTYTLFGARRMNPFDNTDHTIPWLLLSPYSPVYLCNPSQSRLFKVKIQDSAGQSFQISRPRFFERWYTDVDEKMARQIPWADAFEDLLSLQQTGKMVDRDTSTWRTPSDWIHGLVHRGSLGPAWGFDQQGLLIKRSIDTKSLDTQPIPKKQGGWRDGAGQVWEKEDEEAATPKTLPASNSNEETSEDFLDDFVDRAAERLGPFPLFGSILSAADSIVAAVDQATKDFEAMSKSAEPETQAEPESAVTKEAANTSTYSTSSSSAYSYENSVAFSAPEEQTAPSKSLISTLTTTVTRTLADGSVETKRVLKRRFADGTEETNESVEVKNLPSVQRTRAAEVGVDKQTQTLPPTADRSQPQHDGADQGSVQHALAQQSLSPEQQTKGDGKEGTSKRSGWFWT